MVYFWIISHEMIFIIVWSWICRLWDMLLLAHISLDLNLYGIAKLSQFQAFIYASFLHALFCCGCYRKFDEWSLFNIKFLYLVWEKLFSIVASYTLNMIIKLCPSNWNKILKIFLCSIFLLIKNVDIALI